MLEMTNDNVVRRNIKRDLPCKLTEEEFTRISRQRVAKEAELAQLQGDLAREKKRRQDQIEAIEEEIAKMQRELHTEHQDRIVPCNDVFVRDELDGTGWVYTIRLDTYVEVERRPATAHETQRFLPGIDVGNGSVLDEARVAQRLAADKAEVSDVPAGDGDAEPEADDDAEEQPKRRGRKAKGE